MRPAVRSDNPPGLVSTIRGRIQGPVLRGITSGLLIVAVLAAIVPGEVGTALATAAITTIVVVPLLRVLWLVHRYRQEHDWRFLAIGLGLLGVVGVGGLLAALGVG